MDEPVIRRYMPITQKALEKTLCAHSVYAHVHIEFIIFTLSPSALSIIVGCVNIMYYVSRIIQFIIYQFRHTDINNYIIRTHPPLTASVRCVSPRAVLPCHREKEPNGEEEKNKFIKNSIALLFYSCEFMYVRAMKSEESTYLHILKIPQHCAIWRNVIITRRMFRCLINIRPSDRIVAY